MDPVGPAPRAERFPGVGDRVLGTVLSDLGDGRFEVRLGDRIVKVQSPQRLEVGADLALMVRQSGSRLALEILEQRIGAPEVGAGLSDRLSALGLPDDPAHREALGALLEEGLPLSRAAVQQVADAGAAFPSSVALAGRAAAFLMAAGLEPTRDLVEALVNAAGGGSLARAATLLQGLDLPMAKDLLARLAQGAWSAPGAGDLAQVKADLEAGLAKLLGGNPRLASLDLARTRLGDVPSGGELDRRAQEAARTLLAIPPGPAGDAEATKLLKSLDPALRQGVAEQLARWEGEAMAGLPWLAQLREAHQSLSEALGEDQGRLLLGRDGSRYAEGVFRPGGAEAMPVKLRIHPRTGQGGRRGGARQGPLKEVKVALALSFTALGGVGAELTADGKFLRTALQAERPETEALLRQGSPELASALRALGYEASVTVSPARAGALGTGFYEALGVAGEPPPRVDFKV